MRQGTVRVSRGGEPLLKLELALAFSPWLRARGLLGRPPPGPGQGLWLRPCNSVHGWFMGYALDLLYLNREGEVLRVVEGFAPWRMSMCRQAHSVVEMAAGECRRLGIGVGDRLQCEQ